MFNLNVKVNRKQKSILFDAMSRNRNILEGRSFALRHAKEDSWKNLVEKLNMYGPQKDVSQWKKCWADLRLAMRKKYEKSKKYKRRKYSLKEYEKHVISSCGMLCSGDEDSNESQNVSNVNSAMVVGSIENVQEEIKQEQADEEIHSTFEVVNMPTEIIREQDLMRGAIKIENVPLSPNDSELNSESIRLLRESPADGLDSMYNSQSPYTCNATTNGRKDIQDAVITEIRNMHHSLLNETMKQTALLKKLLNALTQ